MRQSQAFVLLGLLATGLANPLPLSPDPAGAKNVGNGKGTQFIGGACLSQADCASACCATLNGAGICSGPGAQFQAGKTGCGFGGTGSSGAASPPPPPATSSTAAGVKVSPVAVAGNPSSTAGVINTSIPGSANVGKGDGSQFITGQCFSNADCASGCCAGLNGAAVCSGPAVGNANGKTGCGFTLAGAGAAASVAPPATVAAAASGGSGKSTVNTNLPGAANVGKGNASQFITGQCFSNADCASGCCAGLNGAGQCSGPAVAFDAGKTGCGFTN